MMSVSVPARDLLVASFKAAVAAADPLQVLPPHLPAPRAGRTLVVGAGKAAASMALAVEQHWPAGAPLEGTVITRYAHGLLTNRITVIEASHPVPDEAGEAAARRILDATKRLGANDLLLALLSGGGSALLSLPVDSVPMADLKAVTRQLLRCGATIQEINAVRKHLSTVQGGRLAAACKAPVIALLISDVTGDEPTHIASGPCAPDPTTYEDALDILARYECAAPRTVLETLQRGARGEIAETPKVGDAVFARTRNRVIATAQQSLKAAAACFEAHGVHAAILGDSVTGEAREVAKVYAALAREIRQHGQPWRPPVALLSGGECTVTVRGKGRGGRCAEFLLSLTNELAGLPGIHAIACDTDGIDGTEDNAGAICSPDSLARARERGLNPDKMLADNDGFGFFSAVGDLIVTGPTRTNVNDYRAILVE
jgi:hydroxypyruvate reductase